MGIKALLKSEIDNNGFKSLKSDLEYSKEEIEAEEKAIKFSITKYKRVKCIPPNLVYWLRGFEGDNESIILLLEEEIKERGNFRQYSKLIIVWRSCDEYSKNRPDIFDLICDYLGIAKKKFWGIIQQAIFDNTELMTKLLIAKSKPELISDIQKFSKKEKNFSDRKLLSEIAKLTDSKPLIEVEQNIYNDNRTANIFANHKDMMRKTDDIIRNSIEEESEQKQLTEGNFNYIEAEVLEEKEIIKNE